jgi:hypothetical protein
MKAARKSTKEKNSKNQLNVRYVCVSFSIKVTLLFITKTFTVKIAPKSVNIAEKSLKTHVGSIRTCWCIRSARKDSNVKSVRRNSIFRVIYCVIRESMRTINLSSAPSRTVENLSFNLTRLSFIWMFTIESSLLAINAALNIL